MKHVTMFLRRGEAPCARRQFQSTCFVEIPGERSGLISRSFHRADDERSCAAWAAANYKWKRVRHTSKLAGYGDGQVLDKWIRASANERRGDTRLRGIMALSLSFFGEIFYLGIFSLVLQTPSVVHLSRRIIFLIDFVICINWIIFMIE